MGQWGNLNFYILYSDFFTKDAPDSFDHEIRSAPAVGVDTALFTKNNRP